MEPEKRPRQLKFSRNEFKPEVSYGNRQICIPMSFDEHQLFSSDRDVARARLHELLGIHPEIFPELIVQSGFAFDGHERESARLPGVRLRRICTKATGKKVVFTIRPSGILPSMVGKTDDVKHGLLMLSRETPIDLVTDVCGRNDMFWYRLISRLGRFSLAGTTLRSAKQLPSHLAADEHHTTVTRIQKVYSCVVATCGVIVGLALSPTADEAGLTKGYGQCKHELQNLNPDYEPCTVNTDGWKATRAAWLSLFVGVGLVLCFLHGFIKVRDRCRKKYPELKARIWDAYRAETSAEFERQLDALSVWSKEQDFPSTVQTYVEKLVNLKASYSKSYEHPGCHRTSNMVDRLMNQLDRVINSGRRLHGHLMSAEYRLRGWALLLNFRPFTRRHQSRQAVQSRSAAERANQTTYHSDWLQNLYVSTSTGGCRI